MLGGGDDNRELPRGHTVLGSALLLTAMLSLVLAIIMLITASVSHSGLFAVVLFAGVFPPALVGVRFIRIGRMRSALKNHGDVLP